MTWDGSKLLKHTLQFLAVLQALFTAMTRVSDYKHHWSDVLIGLLLGSTVAIINVSNIIACSLVLIFKRTFIILN